MSLQSIQQSLNDSVTDSIPDSQLPRESVIILKGPDYHESGPKMRRVDLLHRQMIEKEKMTEMYRSLGRKMKINQSSTNDLEDTLNQTFDSTLNESSIG